MFKKKFLSKVLVSIIALSAASPALGTFACTTVIVGKDATADGSTVIARNEDSNPASAKHFVVRKAKDNPAGTIYTSKGNGFKCVLPKHQYKYTATPEWSDFEGQFEEAGINEKGVAMSATETIGSNAKVMAVDPFVENGIEEDAMETVVLPYIKSAREGVQRLGDIITKQGAGEADGIIFSDKNEVWYMEIGSGHEWVARRVPDNSYAVIANQTAIEDVDFSDSKDYMYSSDLKSFVENNKLNPDENGKFIFRDIFGTNNDGDAIGNIPRVWDGQRILSPSQTKDQKVTAKDIPLFRTPDQKITVEDVGKVLSSHFAGTDYDVTEKDYSKYNYWPINNPTNQESHIIQLRPNMPDQISGIQWVAMASPETSVYVPFYAGITTTPKAYQIGTNTPDTKSAFWTYRMTQVLATPHYNDFLSKFIQPFQTTVNKQLNDNIVASDKKALSIYKSNPSKLTSYLNKEGQKDADYALREFRKLNNTLIKESTGYLPLYNQKCTN
ncbi:C69 family dipeptidase [Clostridium oryzae]|uniref:Dipeptidase n=1 Tax=Clostridium oryzae TaxID=1450648 RepID=A0A1V4IUM0_9CLOT|nr:C69 family dipeptidase [Clostridium oryzae]OPJ63593.1 dipeptidase [Clostridium oryzae]